MVAAKTYEVRAEETRALARAAVTADLRELLHELAATYDRLAGQLAERAARQAKQGQDKKPFDFAHPVTLVTMAVSMLTALLAMTRHLPIA